MTESTPQIGIRHTQPRDFAGIVELCQRVYPDNPPWRPAQLRSHLHVFPEGQFVAVIGPEERVVGMAACCIVDWDHYHVLDSWETFTADGMFTNHDPVQGRTLYGAEIIVTEYGVCDLRGKSTTERALGLIEIAHPQFRDELLAQAKELGYVN
jgi:Acetyl-CoA hydrolase/transferase C-terminal domain